MSEYNERKLLRRLQALSHIEPDLESTERAMAGARRKILELKEEPASPRRFLDMPSPRRLLAYAVSAVILIAIGFGFALLWEGPGEQGGRRGAIPPDTLTDNAPPAPRKGPDSSVVEVEEPAPAIGLELQMIMELARAGDIEGLIDVLHEGEFAGKLVAAGYLVEIGDARAIEPLERLSSRWYGHDQANPFAIAVKAIKDRIALETAGEPKEATSPDDDAVPAAGLEPKGLLCGLVTDARTGEPVARVRLRISGPDTYDLETGDDGFYHLDEIAEDGEYRIDISSADYLGPREPVSITLSRDGRAVRHFALEPGCRIDVHVVNDANEPLADVRLITTWLEGEDTDACPIQTTDVNGHARLGAIRPSDIAYLITAWRDDLAPAHRIVKASDPAETVRTSIVMHRGMQIEGHARYPDGTAAGGLKISAVPRWWPGHHDGPVYQTDADGFFVLGNIVPGMYKLQVHIPYGNGSLVPAPGEIELPPPGGLVRVHFSGPDMADITVENITAPTDDIVVEIRYAPKP